MNQRGQAGLWAALVVGGIAVVVFFFMFLGSGAQVNAGNVGVLSQWGAIDKGQVPLAPGFHLINPFGTHIESVSTQPQNHTFREVGAASRELQNVYVDGGINYSVLPNQAAELTIEGGPEAIISKVLDPAFQDYIKETVPGYPAACGEGDVKCINILNARGQIREAVLSKLQSKADPYGLHVNDVFVTNIHFDKNYTDAIEKAAVANQNLAQAKIDAQSKVAVANGQRDAAISEAQGEAEANRLKQASISQQLIEYTYAQAALKWNGTLPTTMTGGAIPFLNVPTAPR